MSGAPDLKQAAALQLEGYNARQAGDYATALEKARAALAACGDTHQLSPCGYALYEEGVALNRSGDSAAAIPILQQRLDQYGDDGTRLGRQGAPGRAEACRPEAGGQGSIGQGAEGRARLTIAGPLQRGLQLRASARTASAAWAPWSRFPPPVRASAWSMFSTVSTPNAHGTPVRSCTSMIPRAASLQT